MHCLFPLSRGTGHHLELWLCTVLSGTWKDGITFSRVVQLSWSCITAAMDCQRWWRVGDRQISATHPCPSPWFGLTSVGKWPRTTSFSHTWLFPRCQSGKWLCAATLWISVCAATTPKPVQKTAVCGQCQLHPAASWRAGCTRQLHQGQSTEYVVFKHAFNLF